jgi:hypothetical protein
MLNFKGLVSRRYIMFSPYFRYVDVYMVLGISWNHTNVPHARAILQLQVYRPNKSLFLYFSTHCRYMEPYHCFLMMIFKGLASPSNLEAVIYLRFGAKVLQRPETEKRKKYLRPCLEQRRSFVPFVVSTVHRWFLIGREAIRICSNRLHFDLQQNGNNHFLL